MKHIIHLRLLPALLLAAASLLSTTVRAQQMNYQGRLTDASGNPLTDGQRVLTFNLYTAATDGTKTWGPYITDGGAGIGHSSPADFVNGRFNVVLGPNDTTGRSLVSGFGGGTRYLEIQDGSNPAMSPRQQVLAAPEALHALLAETVPNGAIGTAQLADGSVTASKIAGGTGVWLGNGPNVYRDAGNVGIGTTTPGFPLTLADSLGDKISLYGQSGNSWGFGIQSGLLQIHSDSSGGDIAFGWGSSAGMTETMRVKGSGNVGIGTPNPIASVGYPANWRGFHTFSPTEGLGIIEGNGAARLHLRNTTGTPNVAQDFVIQNLANKVYFSWLGAGLGGRLDALAIDSAGAVGIGTTTPTQAKLVVNGSGGVQGPANYYKAEYQVGIGDVSGAPRNIGIYANQSIWTGAALISSSDQRIKNIEGRSDRALDLQTLLGIEITDYRFKDVVGNGNAPHKKVIAQQVEKVFPQAVSKQTDVVPDIYKSASIHHGWVSLETSLKKGERVKLIGTGTEGIHEVLEVTRDKFRTDFKPTEDRVFVYGRQVHDFRTVDYEAIAMLNVSATQELAKRLEKLEIRESHLAVLEEKASRLAALEQEVAEMKRMVARLTAAGDTPQTAKFSAPNRRFESATDAARVTVE